MQLVMQYRIQYVDGKAAVAEHGKLICLDNMNLPPMIGVDIDRSDGEVIRGMGRP